MTDREENMEMIRIFRETREELERLDETFFKLSPLTDPLIEQFARLKDKLRRLEESLAEDLE